MDFKLVNPSKSFLHPGTFLKKFDYTDDNERQYVRQVVKLAQSHQTRIHLLAGAANVPHGFLALSVSRLQDLPCIVINYLFTSRPYRGMKFQDLGDARISEYLVDFAIRTATEIDGKVPIRYVALAPVHDKLIPFYKKWGFKSLDKTEWMYLRI